MIDVLKANGTIRFDTQFCEAVGITKGNLWNVRNGKAHFTVKHIDAICRAYKVRTAFIFGLTDKVFTETAPPKKATPTYP